VVVEKRELISCIAEQACGGIYSINSFVRNASALVVIVSEKEGFLRKVGKYLKGTDYYLLDIGIAGEHLVLQAAELGIGSCWIGWFNEKRLKQILNIPRGKRVDVMIALGYPASQPGSKPRKAMQETISFNSY
jgi:nitroreductase